MSARHPAGWEILASEIVIETPHLRLRSDTIRLPDGTEVGPYFVRESRGFAVVFALDSADRVVLVRQYKHGFGEVLLELPAGAIDPGETPLACAARELAEETGYVSGAPLEHVGAYVYDPTSSTSSYHLYIARSAEPRVAQHFDATEAIDVELATLTEVRRYVRDGTIRVGTHVACVYAALDRLGAL